jgi:hypothetical protein
MGPTDSGDSGERRTPQGKRFQRRDGDTLWSIFLAMLLRQAKAKAVAIAGTLGTFVGTAATIAVFRLFVMDKVATMEAQHSGRMTSIEVAAMIDDSQRVNLTARVDTLTDDMTSLIYAKCDEHSKSEQRRYRMRCPAELYRGAPR